MTVSHPRPTVTPAALIPTTSVTADTMSVHTTGAWASFAPASASIWVSRAVVSMAWMARKRGPSTPMRARCSIGRRPNSDTHSSISSRSRLMWVIIAVSWRSARSRAAANISSLTDGTLGAWM